jgi:hypothetical protein
MGVVVNTDKAEVTPSRLPARSLSPSSRALSEGVPPRGEYIPWEPYGTPGYV